MISTTDVAGTANDPRDARYRETNYDDAGPLKRKTRTGVQITIDGKPYLAPEGLVTVQSLTAVLGLNPRTMSLQVTVPAQTIKRTASEEFTLNHGDSFKSGL